MTLILGQDEVRRLLPMPTCIELMADAFAALAQDLALCPLRRVMRRADGVLLGTMPAALPDALGIKVIAIVPGNAGTALDPHQGLVLLMDPDTGVPQAILDATEVTAIRTAAVSALATRLLARPDADDLALLGAGTQAWTHLEAMHAVRPLRRVRVHSRTPARREAFARRAAVRLGVEVVPHAEPEAAVRGASLICTLTSAREPVLRGAWLSPGAHVNAVGACTPAARELDALALARARLFVDRRESALAEAGDFLLARAEGAVRDAHILGELGDLVLGRLPGRRAEGDITLFKSLGLGLADLAAARHVYREALAAGVGVRVALGGAAAS